MNYFDMWALMHPIDFSLEWLIEFVSQSWWRLTLWLLHHPQHSAPTLTGRDSLANPSSVSSNMVG